MKKIQPYFTYLVGIVISSSLNFFVFLEAYKELAFPFLHEEQRVENAPYIFLYVLPCFILISILSLFLYKKVFNRLCTKKLT